jgi:hypothetical protein
MACVRECGLTRQESHHRTARARRIMLLDACGQGPQPALQRLPRRARQPQRAAIYAARCRTGAPAACHRTVAHSRTCLLSGAPRLSPHSPRNVLADVTCHGDTRTGIPHTKRYSSVPMEEGFLLNFRMMGASAVPPSAARSKRAGRRSEHCGAERTREATETQLRLHVFVRPVIRLHQHSGCESHVVAFEFFGGSGPAGP